VCKNSPNGEFSVAGSLVKTLVGLTLNQAAEGYFHPPKRKETTMAAKRKSKAKGKAKGKAKRKAKRRSKKK
jgi:hypothetical protein